LTGVGGHCRVSDNNVIEAVLMFRADCFGLLVSYVSTNLDWFVFWCEVTLLLTSVEIFCYKSLFPLNPYLPVDGSGWVIKGYGVNLGVHLNLVAAECMGYEGCTMGHAVTTHESLVSYG
jgi:hypothetical protein